TLNVRFSNDKLLSMGMPKPPRFTDYIARCVMPGLTTATSKARWHRSNVPKALSV
ncbi:hypothetical protein ABKW02_23760, partial [Enterobacter cloacae]|uniref:hypothetical protein n=1 Tax=Enterobacter cloacae TaxID=550 RepID=UPI0032AFD2E5